VPSLKPPAAVGAATTRRPLTVATMGADLAWAGRVTKILRRGGVDAAVRCVHSPETTLAALVPAPDVVLLAHRHDGTQALRRIHRVRQRLPHAAIVAVVPQGAERSQRELVSAGADGLIVETDLDTGLALVVHVVGAGYVALPRRLRQLVEPPALSHREKQTLALALVGRTNAEIAQRLCLGESTVKTHLSSAFRRLGVSSRREAAVAVLHRDQRLREDVLRTLRTQPQGGPWARAPSMRFGGLR
jgi:DNA-binding NarL/FixJ family response regulator